MGLYTGPVYTIYKALSAARLDEMHEAGEDLSAHLDLAKATRPGRDVQRVNVDFPVDLLRAIDREAKPDDARRRLESRELAGIAPVRGGAAAVEELSNWELRTGRAHPDYFETFLERMAEARAGVAAILAADVDSVALTHA